MKIWLFFIYTILFVSCSTPEEINSTRVPINSSPAASEIQKYLLAELPYWANFSSHGMCRKNVSIRYMNFKNLSRSFNLSYEQLVHLQSMFNKKVSAYRTSLGADALSSTNTTQDESFIFYNVYEQVMAGSFDFRLNRFPKVSVIWVDDFLGRKQELKKLMKRDDILSGYPVFLSQCLSYYELEKLTQNLKIDNLGIKFIPAEMFSHYSSKIKEAYDFSLDLSKILKDKTIMFYATKEPKNILGIQVYKEL